MDLSIDDDNYRLIGAIQHGLPLVPRPYAEIGARIGMSENEVMDRIQALMACGVIKRMGIIVRHHELGYRANAMVVWDVPDQEVDGVGARMAGFEHVTLCYRRPRRAGWPYNLFCMIHGRDRDAVRVHVDALARRCGLEAAPRDVLFSRRRFKQRGALYVGAAPR